MTIDVWVYFSVLNSIALINLSVSGPMPCCLYHYCSVEQIEVRYGDSHINSFIVENYFGYLGFFVFPQEAENCSFYDCEELCWDFDGDCIESADCILRANGWNKKISFWLR